MAGVSTGQGENKLNTELNLVPFIDLLSTLTLFLLITAVWVQISAIPAGVKSAGEVVTSEVPEEELLDIHLTDKGYEISLPKALENDKTIPRLVAKAPAGFDDKGLGDVLSTLATGGQVKTLAVSAEDFVDYGEVVHAIDVARGRGFPAVALSTN